MWEGCQVENPSVDSEANSRPKRRSPEGASWIWNSESRSVNDTKKDDFFPWYRHKRNTRLCMECCSDGWELLLSTNTTAGRRILIQKSSYLPFVMTDFCFSRFARECIENASHGCCKKTWTFAGEKQRSCSSDMDKQNLHSNSNRCGTECHRKKWEMIQAYDEGTVFPYATKRDKYCVHRDKKKRKRRRKRKESNAHCICLDPSRSWTLMTYAPCAPLRKRPHAEDKNLQSIQ